MYKPLFNCRNIYPADIFHIRTAGKYGDAIRRITGSVGTHDALFINCHTVGESTAKPPIAHFTDLEEYEDKMRAGHVHVSILRIPFIDMADRYAIATSWCQNVRGRFYDFSGIAKLWLKRGAISMLPDDSELGGKALGWEWANWCTEGVRTACLKAKTKAPHFDPFGKENPTPRTVENRLRAGKLWNVTEECLTEEGKQYRLDIPKTM